MSNFRKLLHLLLAAGILLSGCASRTPEPTQVPTTTSTLTATPSLIITPTPGPTTTPLPPTALPEPEPLVPEYTLDVKLDYSAHHVDVVERIEYPNTSTDTLIELHLLVETAVQDGVWSLNSAAQQDGKTLTPVFNKNDLIVPLVKPLEPGETITIILDYALALPSIPEPDTDSKPVVFGYTNRQTNLVDWYAVVPPYQNGSGFLLHKSSYYGESQVYASADFNVNLELINPPANLTVAASAEAETDGAITRYHRENARSFALSISTEYLTYTQVVDGVTITSYAFSPAFSGGQGALENTSEALQLYNELFGPYPNKTLAVVEADFLDGMEYDGLYFLSKAFYNLYDGTPRGYLTTIAVHETAHQWFYAQVGNDQAMEPWLDEAFCTFAEYLYYSNLHPDSLSWWWSVRVDFYKPQGYINLPVYDYHGFRAYRDAVYLNGAHFLVEIKDLVGEKTMTAILQAYVAEYKGKIATASDFFAVVAEHSDVDLSQTLQKYFSND